MTGKIFRNIFELRDFLKNGHGVVVIEEEKGIFVAYDEQGSLNDSCACRKLQNNLQGAIHFNIGNDKKIFFVKRGKDKKCRREENSIFCKECYLYKIRLFVNLMTI